MNLVAQSLGFSTLILGWLVFVGALLLAIKSAPWHKVKNDRSAQNVWLGMSLILFFVWQFAAQMPMALAFIFY